MNEKIIEIETEGNVLVYRDRDSEDGGEIVCIRAWVNDDHLVERIVGMPDEALAMAYVRDFSKESAEEFWQDAKADWDNAND